MGGVALLCACELDWLVGGVALRCVCELDWLLNSAALRRVRELDWLVRRQGVLGAFGQARLARGRQSPELPGVGSIDSPPAGV